MSVDWKGFKQNLLASCQDFAPFYEGVKTKGRPNADGWVTAFCPFHTDKEPSFGINVITGRWGCFAGCGSGSVFDYLIHRSEARDMVDALSIVAEHLGIPMPKPKKPKLDPAMLDGFERQLSENKLAMRWLTEERALDVETIKAWRLGFDRKTILFPLWSNGKLVNIRRRSANGVMSHWSEKVGLQWVAYGTPPRLYPNNDVDKSKLVILCEGEIDCLILRQLGFQAFTGTHGSGKFLTEWLSLFVGCDVVIVYDVDDAGRKGATHAAEELVKVAASVRIVELPLPGEKGDNDVSDWYRSHEGSAESLLALIESATRVESGELPAEPSDEDPIRIDSLREIEAGDLIGKLVEVDITITGTTSDSYTIPEVVKIGSCKGEKKGLCYDCKGAVSDHPIPLGESVRLSACHSSRSYAEGELGRYCCKHDRRPQVDIVSSGGAREVFAHAMIDRVAGRASEEILERRVFLREEVDEPKPGNYHARGWVLALPKTHQTTLLIEHMVRIQDDFESFDPDEHVEQLKLMQSIEFDDLVADLRDHVTRIYKRDDLLASVLLTLFSPRWITFRGRKVRGWLNTFIVGDAGTGKTATYEGLARHLGVGDLFSALTGSRTGLLYAVVESRSGWEVRVGRHPQNSRRILAVDEVQNLAEWELRTLSKAMEEGHFRVDRVVSREYESETRMVMMANPKGDRSLDEFSFGCRAFATIAPPAVIRRIDLPLVLSSGDLDSLPLGEVSPSPSRVPVEALRAAVLWAWSLEPEEVTFTEGAEATVLREADLLTAEFGGAPDLPLMHRSDAHNTLARLSAARAAVSLRTEGSGFDALRVDEADVLSAAALWRRVAGSPACGLREYSDMRRAETEVLDPDGLVADFAEGLQRDAGMGWPLRHVLNALLQDGSTCRADLELLTGATESDLGEVVRFLRMRDMIRASGRGSFRSTPKLVRFVRILRDRAPSLFRGATFRLGPVPNQALGKISQASIPMETADAPPFA